MAGETILVVDDSPTIRKVVSLNLARAGYSVAVAMDGQQGLEMAQEVNPQLILLDFVMPRMNGFQFCVALKGIANLANLPIVLMSAKGDKIGAKFIQQMGAVDSITKPFSPEALLAVIGHVLKKAREGIEDGTARFHVDEPLESLDEDEREPGVMEIEESDTSPRWDRLSLAENQQARYVGEQIAARVVDILASAIPELAPRGDEIEEVLARHLSPKALASMSQIIAQMEPSAGQAAFAGDIASVPLAEVFQLLQLQTQSGCFEIRRDRFRVIVFFRDGLIQLVQAREGRSEFLLGRYMVEDEIIGRTELDLLLRNRAPEDGALLGQQLVARGYLSQEELIQILERQSSELMYEVLRWRRGRYAFRPGVTSREADNASLGLSAESVLLEGFRRVDEWRVIEQQIEDFDVVFLRDDAAVERFGRDRLTRDEMSVLDAVNGRRNVHDIIEQTQMGSFFVSKLLYRLLSVKLIQKRRG